MAKKSVLLNWGANLLWGSELSLLIGHFCGWAMRKFFKSTPPSTFRIGICGGFVRKYGQSPIVELGIKSSLEFRNCSFRLDVFIYVNFFADALHIDKVSY